MPERDIILNDLKDPHDLFRLKEYIQELYRSLDRRAITIDYGASITVDADEADLFLVTLTGNITGITIKNPYVGREVTFTFLQDGSGGHTVAGWDAIVMLSGNAFTATSTANRYSSITFRYENSKWVEVGRALDVY